MSKNHGLPNFRRDEVVINLKRISQQYQESIKEDDEIVDVKYLSKFWGKDEQTIRRWVKQEGLPSKQPGRAYQFILKEAIYWNKPAILGQRI